MNYSNLSFSFSKHGMTTLAMRRLMSSQIGRAKMDLCAAFLEKIQNKLCSQKVLQLLMCLIPGQDKWDTHSLRWIRKAKLWQFNKEKFREFFESWAKVDGRNGSWLTVLKVDGLMKMDVGWGRLKWPRTAQFGPWSSKVIVSLKAVKFNFQFCPSTFILLFRPLWARLISLNNYGILKRSIFK